jgi:hypothetical protein
MGTTGSPFVEKTRRYKAGSPQMRAAISRAVRYCLLPEQLQNGKVQGGGGGGDAFPPPEPPPTEARGAFSLLERASCRTIALKHASAFVLTLTDAPPSVHRSLALISCASMCERI